MSTVLKFGGELLETSPGIEGAGCAIAALAARGPLVVVHGGGREIDAELARRSITKRAVDGLRITDAATLEVVVAVLAGSINTRLVAAAVAAGAAAVGLTGADAHIVEVEPAAPFRAADGRLVDLELVGNPVRRGAPRLLVDLCRQGYVPVLASIGLARDGRLFNVNADTLAAHLATALGSDQLVIAGATDGVLDEAGRTIPSLEAGAIDALVAGGAVRAGMIAKLRACREALTAGVERVFIVDGRHPERIAALKGTELTNEELKAES